MPHSKYASNSSYTEIELTDGTVLTAWGKACGDADNPVHLSDVVENLHKLVADGVSLTVSLNTWHYPHSFIRCKRNDGCERTV